MFLPHRPVDELRRIYQACRTFLFIGLGIHVVYFLQADYAGWFRWDASPAGYLHRLLTLQELALHVRSVAGLMIFILAWHISDRSRHCATLLLGLCGLTMASVDMVTLYQLASKLTSQLPPSLTRDSAAILPIWQPARLLMSATAVLVLLMPPGRRCSRRTAWRSVYFFLLFTVLLNTILFRAYPTFSLTTERAVSVSGLFTLAIAILACLVAWLRIAFGAAPGPRPALDRIDLFCATLALLIAEAYFNLRSADLTAHLLPALLFQLLTLIFFFRALLNGGIRTPYTILSDTAHTLQCMSSVLQKREQRLSAMIRNASDAIISVDEYDRIVLANPAAAAMFRTTQAAMCGGTMQRYLSPNRIGQERKQKPTTYQTNSLRTGLRADGETFALEASISAMVEQDRRYAILILRDVTERHKKQEELRHTTEQLRQFSATLQSGHEATRKNIARDLHDDLGQLLAALRIDLSLLQKQAGQPEASTIQLDNMDAILTSAIAALRRIATEVRPRALDEGGLYFALQSLRNDFIAQHGIDCELIAQEVDLILNEQLSTAVFRIVQEALTNVYRHANARWVHISLERQTDVLLIRIRDDGRGIGEGDFRTRLRSGLKEMTERIRTLRGKISFCNQPTGGLQIEVWLPVNNGL